MARAAKREVIVASAISKRLAALESELGVALLVRARRGIRPTAAGEVLLRQAHDILGAMARTHAELSEFASGVHGSVRVLASLSALSEFLADDIARFLAQHQAVRVSVVERVSSQIVRGVREGAADLGVLWEAGDMTGLETAGYRVDHLHVVVHPSHPLARRKRLRFEETLEFDAVGVVPGSIMEATLRRHAALAGKPLLQRIEVSTFDAACRIVAANLGITVLPIEAAGPYVQALKLRMVPLADAWAVRRFVICMRRHSALPAAARQLVDQLQSQSND
jgi:DNA-binding transcriptional LysR family regulator